MPARHWQRLRRPGLDSAAQPALGQGGRPVERRSSPIARRGFCSHCGTPITLAYDGSEEIALHAGTLDRPEAFPPGYHYGVESRLAWADCGAGLPSGKTKERWDGA